MEFNVERAIPINNSNDRQPAFDVGRAVPVGEPSQDKFTLQDAGNIVMDNLKATPRGMLNEVLKVAQVIRWPYWRFIEHPTATLIEAAQNPEGKTLGGTLSRAAQAYVPFKKIPPEEYGSYGKVWDNYYQSVMQLKGYEKDEVKTPDWYVLMASYGSAGVYEPLAIKTGAQVTEAAMTRKATDEEAAAVRSHFEPLKSSLEKRGLNTKDLYPEGNIIKVDNDNEVFINKYLSAVLRGDEVRVPRWAKIKMASNIAKVEPKGTGLVPEPPDVLPSTGTSIELTAGVAGAEAGAVADMGQSPQVDFKQNPKYPGIKDIVSSDQVVGEVGYQVEETEFGQEATDFDIKINKDARSQGLATSAIQKVFDSGVDKISGQIIGDDPSNADAHFQHLDAKRFWLNRGASISGNNMSLYKEDFNPGPSPERQAKLETPNIVAKKISAKEVENMLDRFYSQNKEMWAEYDINSWKDFLKRDPDTLDMELSSDYETMKRYLDRFKEDENISPIDLVEAYKKGVLPQDRMSLFVHKPGSSKINIENIPTSQRTDFWSPKTKQLDNPKEVFALASQKVINANKEDVMQARKDLFLAYNTDPELADKLGIKRSELNKKIRSISSYPSKAAETQMRMNAGVPEEFKWVGIENLAWINRQDIQPDVLDKFVKSVRIGKGMTKGYFGDAGEMLRRYIINTILGIDTRLLFNDLSFEINQLDKALGLFEPSKILITINNVNSNTVSHEIGHYLDYKFGRELGMTHPLSELFDSANISLLKEKHNLSDDHINWAKKFYDYVMDVSERGDISSEYRQRRAEVFARLVAKFVEWANDTAGIKHFKEDRYYSDKFTQADYQGLVRLLQEKSYLDEKYKIKPLVQSQSGRVETMAKEPSQFQHITPKVISKLQSKIDELKTIEEKRDLARESLQQINDLRNELKGRIKKYEGGFLAEELRAIPKFYITTEANGSTPDEIMQEMRNNYGMEFDNENDLISYLNKLENTKKSIGAEIETYKPKMVQMREATLAKKQLKAAESAAKAGQRQMEKALKQGEKEMAREKKRSFREGRQMEAELRKKRYFGNEITPEQRRELYVVALNKGVIYTDYSGKTHDKLQGIIRYYKGASFDQLKNYLNNLSGDKENPPKLFKLYGDINKDAAAMEEINKDRENWQDINAAEVFTLDPPRIIEKVSKQPIWEQNPLADNTFNVISAADEAMFDRKILELKDLEENRQGIHANSKESAEIMRKFEAREQMTDKEQKVVNFLRAKYEMWINEANNMRELLGKKPIPHRQDYMAHIQEQNILHDFFVGNEQGMGKITNEQMDAIRRGDFTRGNMPFNQFAQKRLGEKTKNDAIGNYLKYMNVLAREIYYTPAITHVRKFIDYALLEQPNAFKAIDRMLNDLKGKKSIVDQNLIGWIASSQPMQWLRTHIARSALIGNINFWAMNLSNFATAYPELGNWVNFGMAKFLGNKEWRNFAFQNSKMLKGRQIDPDFIDQPVHTKIEEVVASVTNLIEYNNMGAVFTGAYHKAIEELGYSPEKAIEYADGLARKTQVGYKPYEVNAWMRSNSGKLYSQFQNWSFNAMNYILYDIGAANIPEDVKSIFKKGDKTNRTRWGAFISLIAVAIAVDQIYKALGLNEPYSPTAAIPSVAGLDVGKYGDIGPVRVIKNIESAVGSKKAVTRRKAAQRVAGSVVPGGTQAVRLIQGNVFPEKLDKNKKKINVGD